MKPTLLLCDWAEAVNGKLYAQGIGWSMTRAHTALNMAVALVVRVEWNETNVRHRLEIRLVDSDDHPIPDEDRQIKAGWEFEIGRPPGIAPGDAQTVVFAANANGLELQPGRYTFNLYYNDNKLPEGVTFTAVKV